MAALQIICALHAEERVVYVVEAVLQQLVHQFTLRNLKLCHQGQTRQKVCKITDNDLKSKNKLYYIFLMLTTGIKLNYYQRLNYIFRNRWRKLP